MKVVLIYNDLQKGLCATGVQELIQGSKRIYSIGVYRRVLDQ